MTQSISEVWNCPEAFEFLCPQKWDELHPTADTNVRHCQVCSENVYWSSNPAEFVSNAKLGRCVSVPQHGMILEGRIGGRVSPEHAQAIEDRREQYKIWEHSWSIVLNQEPAFILFLLRKGYPNALAFFIELAKNFPEERDLLTQAEQLLSNSDSRDQFAIYLIEIGQIDRAIAIARTLTDISQIAMAIGKLVSVNMPEDALKIFPMLTDGHTQYSFLIRIADKLAEMGQIERSVEVFERYLKNTQKNFIDIECYVMKRLTTLRSMIFQNSCKQVLESQPKPFFAVNELPVEQIEIKSGRKAMTWGVLDLIILNGKPYALFGADAFTNPYSGDTDINAFLPLLCIKKMNLPKPARLPNPIATNGGALRGSWSGGKVIAVPDVQGKQLTSHSVADVLCRLQGFEVLREDGFRMAEFHDGEENAGWDFWADVSAMSMLKISDTRYWVSINDQPGNPWEL